MGNTAPMKCDHPFDWEEVVKPSGNILPGREGHSGVFYNGCLYFFGGIQDASVGSNDDEEQEFPTVCMNDLYQYDIQKNEWQCVSSSGDIPSPRSAFIATVLNDQLFVYGGLDPLYGWMTDGFTFDFSTKIWKKVDIQGEIPSPRDKTGYTTLNNNQVIVFGGFGPQNIELEEEEEDTATFGWFNETFIFDIQEYRWTKLNCTGDFPTPRAAPGVALLQRPKQVPVETEKKEGEQAPPSYKEEGEDKTFLYVMGGRDNLGSRTNDLFSLDIESLVWTKHQCRGAAPVGRSFHSCVGFNDKIFVFGGANPAHQVMNDIHILDTRAESQHAWVQPKTENLNQSKQPRTRAFHATVSTEIQDHLYVYVHGGASDMDSVTGEHLNFCHNMWRIDLSPLLSYRAPTLEQIKAAKEEEKRINL